MPGAGYAKCWRPTCVTPSGSIGPVVLPSPPAFVSSERVASRDEFQRSPSSRFHASRHRPVRSRPVCRHPERRQPQGFPGCRVLSVTRGSRGNPGRSGRMPRILQAGHGRDHDKYGPPLQRRGLMAETDGGNAPQGGWLAAVRQVVDCPITTGVFPTSVSPTRSWNSDRARAQ